ncbi:MAG: hypothetical protein JST50_17220 [Bacteroidetes bacterium]|jgi:hypothetical protein|nr:hypothetical protein [Bacteroidota bacterium]
MKSLKPLLVAFVILFTAYKSSAQSAFSGLIKAGPDDATKLLNAYADPLFKGFGTGMNSNWTNTAKTKKLLHFDIRVSGSAAIVPSSDKSFDVTKIGLSNHLGPQDPTQTITPTFSGDKNGTPPTLNVYDDNHQKVSEFQMPSGKLSIIPSPQVQITVGLPKNTDITLRGIPQINFGSNVGSVSMIGVGLKHDIIQDFVGKKADKIIPFDLAVSLGYSRLNMSVPLDVQPDQGAQPANAQQSTDFSNQHFEGHFNSFIAQAIVSKKLVFFTPFLAVGYSTANANVATIGNYPVTTGETLLGQSTYTTFPNPINIKETTVNGVRADIGFQLELAFFRFYASYSAAKYQSFSGGFGFGF